MKAVKVRMEIGKVKTFASAVDWPGWCRSGRDESSALDALLDYGPRYAHVLFGSDLDFQVPMDGSVLEVIECLGGNSTTDFGAPAVISVADKEPMDQLELEVVITILTACWHVFDNMVEKAQGKELTKGPRGGGRDLEKILRHVLEGDKGYLRRIAWKPKRSSEGIFEALRKIREEILTALEIAVNEGLPERGPRGGVIWPPRFFCRRVAWHVLDHAWEIEDRIPI
jgi:hypothetical protein